MSDVLIAEQVLREREGDIGASVTPVPSMSYGDDACRRAFLYHSLFRDERALGQLGFAFSAEQAFYNSYFWFLVFSKCEQALSGYDAGLEQGAFKLLEEAHSLDWKCVEEVTRRAEEWVTQRANVARSR